MKIKGKKAIMAAALSAVVAASSFSTAASASTSMRYACFPEWDNNDVPAGAMVSNLFDDQGNATGTTLATPGKTYTMKFYTPPESGKVLSKVYIVGDENSAVYPNCSGWYGYTFVMPAKNITIFTEFKDAPPATDPEPAPTPTPTPDPTPTLSWKKGDANCDGIVTAADATAVLKHLAGIIELSYIGSVNADMDQNGKVTAADATAILKFLINEQ